MKRSLAIIAFAGAVLLSTHILAPAQSPAPPPPVTPADLATIDQDRPLVETVDAQVGRLRERLSTTTEYSTPVRDPFRFGARPEAPRPTTAAPVILPVPIAPAPAVVLPHIVAILSPLATGAGDVERSVSLAMGDDLKVVKTGETFLHFVVRRIDADAVELLDPATGATYKISLN